MSRWLELISVWRLVSGQVGLGSLACVIRTHWYRKKWLWQGASSCVVVGHRQCGHPILKVQLTPATLPLFICLLWPPTFFLCYEYYHKSTCIMSTCCDRAGFLRITMQGDVRNIKLLPVCRTCWGYNEQRYGGLECLLALGVGPPLPSLVHGMGSHRAPLWYKFTAIILGQTHQQLADLARVLLTSNITLLSVYILEFFIHVSLTNALCGIKQQEGWDYDCTVGLSWMYYHAWCT